MCLSLAGMCDTHDLPFLPAKNLQNGKSKVLPTKESFEKLIRFFAMMTMSGSGQLC
ncbi:hypothetical protein GW12_26790 [Acinetobacter sp. HR7]|nr:hypothetical protein GW12_26790 [Acinetobacter sp. HR7]